LLFDPTHKKENFFLVQIFPTYSAHLTSYARNEDGKDVKELKLTTHSYLVTRLRINGAKPPLWVKGGKL